MLGICKFHLLPCSTTADEPKHCCSCRLHVEPGRAKSKRFERRLLTRRLLFGCMTTGRSKPGRTIDRTSGSDAVEGGVFQSLGNLCFRSRYSDYLWNTSISAPYRVTRVAAMTLISLILLARSWRLFVRYRHQSPHYSRLSKSSFPVPNLTASNFVYSLVYRPSPAVALVLSATPAAGWQFGAGKTILLLMLALLLTLAKQLASTPEVNSGHRAGGKGFEGDCCFHSCLTHNMEQDTMSVSSCSWVSCFLQSNCRC